MTEIWTSILGYEGIYEVSDMGRVKRLLPSKRFAAGHILKPKRIGQGYVGVCLYRDGKSKAISIHKLVMRSFVGAPPGGMNINHKDANKKNNSLANLEYVTLSQNSAHAFAMGLLFHVPAFRGQENGNASLTEKQAIEIATRLHGGERPCDIARAMGVSRCPVDDIKSRRKWKYLFAPSGPLAHLPPQQRHLQRADQN
jgi:hypothetical protein